MSGRWAVSLIQGRNRAAASVLSAFVVLLSCSLMAATNWRQWHWGLFAWGLGLILAGVGYAIGSERLVLRLIPGIPDSGRAAIRARQRTTMATNVIIGLGIAVLAAGTGWVAVDLGFTVLFVLAGGLATLVGLRSLRR